MAPRTRWTSWADGAWIQGQNLLFIIGIDSTLLVVIIEIHLKRNIFDNRDNHFLKSLFSSSRLNQSEPSILLTRHKCILISQSHIGWRHMAWFIIMTHGDSFMTHGWWRHDYVISDMPLAIITLYSLSTTESKFSLFIFFEFGFWLFPSFLDSNTIYDQ